MGGGGAKGILHLVNCMGKDAAEHYLEKKLWGVKKGGEPSRGGQIGKTPVMPMK